MIMDLDLVLKKVPTLFLSVRVLIKDKTRLKDAHV
jgi:hypothetical protein